MTEDSSRQRTVRIYPLVVFFYDKPSLVASFFEKRQSLDFLHRIVVYQPADPDVLPVVPSGPAYHLVIFAGRPVSVYSGKAFGEFSGLLLPLRFESVALFPVGHFDELLFADCAVHRYLVFRSGCRQSLSVVRQYGPAFGLDYHLPVSGGEPFDIYAFRLVEYLYVDYPSYDDCREQDEEHINGEQGHVDPAAPVFHVFLSCRLFFHKRDSPFIFSL